MKVAYFSVTGQVKRFVAKLGLENFSITDFSQEDATSDYILIVPTYEEMITEPADDFLEDYSENCLGVVGSGNRNFGDEFVFTAKDLAKKYDIPMLYAFEFNGTQEDVQNVLNLIEEIR
ncbi:class Ib ribonucleoside-diphosphate reductase assembly flavoprotein NrdI [Streptococcaceae bacterium ESL0687]|nr:class Ib ribonucleoside-diphosphate reductase assembly flavoprotein NrdI [Streptococcaceae bacterium ESL0687]